MCDSSFASRSAGEHVRLRTGPLLPALPLHRTGPSAGSTLSRRQPLSSVSTTLTPFPPLIPPVLPRPPQASYSSKPSSSSSSSSSPLCPAPDIVIGNNGTSHRVKSEALSTALPSSLQFLLLSDSCGTILSSASYPHLHDEWVVPDHLDHQRPCQKREEKKIK